MSEPRECLAPFWVTFSVGSAGCFEAISMSAAKREAEAMATVSKIERIPYPAMPRLSAIKSDCPPFCRRPAACVGRVCCPLEFACND